MITCFGNKDVSLVPCSFLTYKFIICLYRTDEQQQNPCNDICKLQKKKREIYPVLAKLVHRSFIMYES